MFQIGEFSRIAQVTIETLRHYDTMGLLKPARVDSNTGYRYYEAGQLQTLNQILALKELGLSLDEIRRILRESLTAEEVQGMLKAQLVQTESAIEDAQRRRQHLLARLERLGREQMVPDYEVTLKATEAFTVASIRETIATVAQIPARWNELFTTIADWLKANNLTVGVPVAFYHDEGYRVADVDTECTFTIPGVAVDQIPEPPEPIAIRQIEAMPQVATVIVANFHVRVGGLADAYAALGQWVADNGYHIAAAPRERYYGSPQTGDFTAEIQFPVSQAIAE